MNLKTGEVKQRQLSSLSTDFPRINEEYTGRKTRFVYCGVFDELNRVIGVVKYDLDEEPCLTTGDLQKGGNVAGVFSLGPGRSGSEAIFVPLKRGMEGPEDDGYLILFVYDENKGYGLPFTQTHTWKVLSKNVESNKVFADQDIRSGDH